MIPRMDANEDQIQITRYWGIAEICKVLGVHQSTVRRWIHLGDLPAVRVGNLLRVSDAHFRMFLKRAEALSEQEDKVERGF